MLYAGGSKTLVHRTFFIMILTWDIQKHWQAPKKQKQTTRCTKHRQAPQKKKTKLPATTQKWTHSSWNCCSFFWFVWYLCRFGASSGLFFFRFFWCLCRFGDSDFTKHWQAPNTTRCTKHRQAPKKKIQQLLRSAPIVPGFFLFFFAPVQVWCI